MNEISHKFLVHNSRVQNRVLDLNNDFIGSWLGLGQIDDVMITTDFKNCTAFILGFGLILFFILWTLRCCCILVPLSVIG